MVRIVSGTPTRAYSQKPIRTLWRARSSTIRFATEPSTVRLPARVDDMASVSHACRASGKCGMNGRNTSTAGTLLTMFESAAANALSTPGRSRCKREAIAKRSADKDVFSTPRTMINDKQYQQGPIDLRIDALRLHAAR